MGDRAVGRACVCERERFLVYVVKFEHPKGWLNQDYKLCVCWGLSQRDYSSGSDNNTHCVVSFQDFVRPLDVSLIMIIIVILLHLFLFCVQRGGVHADVWLYSDSILTLK